MVKVSEILIVLACTLAMTSAAVWRGPLEEKPEEFKNVDGCYVKKYNTVIPFGEYITPLGECVRVACTESEVVYAGCGVIGIAPEDKSKCYVTDEDVSKPYPDCCPMPKCDFSNDLL